MLLFRYFGFMGGALVALLFVANWIWPTEPTAPAPATSTESPVEQMIRIKSARRWPEKIVFDTSQRTIVPPAPVVEASAPPPTPAPVVAASAPLEARAELKPAAPPPKRQAKVRHRYARQDYGNPRPDAWHDPWHDPWRHTNTFASAGPMAPSWSFGRW